MLIKIITVKDKLIRSWVRRDKLWFRNRNTGPGIRAGPDPEEVALPDV
jgi:hypothetical protein